MCDTMESVKKQLENIENEITNIDDLETEFNIEKPALHTMPVEIILKICSFLDAQFLKNTLSKVCQRFDDILADDDLWRYWVHSKIKGTYPVIRYLKLWNEESINWEEICVEMNTEMRKWTNVKDTMNHVVIKDVHFASVDTVLLINNGDVCISGGRDRGMCLWNVLNVEGDNTQFINTDPKVIKHDAHAGWIWDLATDDYNNTKTIYSSSWDNTVKSWDLTTGLDCVETFRCGMSALAVTTIEHEVVVGLYSKKILSFDPREGNNPVYSYKVHGAPVLALEAVNNIIYSVSEDKSLAVWDRKAGKLLYQVKIPNDKAFPVCICWAPTALYIGDSKGVLHLFDPETHKHKKSFEIWTESQKYNKITRCHQSKGNIIIASDKGEIKFAYNSNPPQEYASVKSNTIDVTQMRYLNGVLAIGTSDSTVELWVPNERHNLNL